MWLGVMQVEAFIKQLPRILPRSFVPDKTHLSVRSSPPSLAPKDASGVGGASGAGGPASAAGGVKVIAMATLPQQQGGAVPVMILPQGCLSYTEREKVAPPPPPQPPPPPPQHAAVSVTPAAPASVVQQARGNVNKRPLEVVTSCAGTGTASGSAASGPPVKRKRGRPRKSRPEDGLPAAAPPPQAPAPPSHPPVITSLSGGVIQKASSSSSQQVVELVFQDQPGLVLAGQLPAVSDLTSRLAVEQRGVVVPCQATEAERHARPVLLLQSSAKTSWELAPSGRTAMVEVIQKAPRPSNNTSNNPQAAAHLPPPPALLPREEEEVAITLMPVDLHVKLPPPSSPSTSSSVHLGVEMIKNEEELKAISPASLKKE